MCLWTNLGPPSVRVTKDLVHGLIGSTNVTLECFINSFPRATNFWMRGDLGTLITGLSLVMWSHFNWYLMSLEYQKVEKRDEGVLSDYEKIISNLIRKYRNNNRLPSSSPYSITLLIIRAEQITNSYNVSLPFQFK